MSLVPTSHDTLIDPAEALRDLLSRPEQWRLLTEPDPGHRSTDGPDRVLLHDGLTDGELELWLLRWLPGQGNGWHSHGDSRGAFVPVVGTLSEWVAQATDPVRPPRVQGRRELETGHVRTFGIPHVHHVINSSPQPAVSLHAYSPALTQTTRYTVVGDLLDVLDDHLIGVGR